MASPQKRNPLLPWYIGGVTNLAVVAIVGYRMHESQCEAAGHLKIAVLVVLPAVYMTLAYLTFKSRD